MLRDFYKNPWISLYCKFCLWTPRRIFAVSADVSRVCDVVYEEERSWSGVNRTVLKIYAALSVRTDLSTVIHREKDQRKKKKEVLLYYVISSKSIRWHPNSGPWCWDPYLLTILFFEITKHKWKSIPHAFNIYLKIDHFGVQFSFNLLQSETG